MTVSIPFDQSYTWRKLGFLYFTDSLSYREVLEQNPQWDVTELPPVGAQLRISSVGAQASNALSQGSFVFDGTDNPVQEFIYPFDTLEDYVVSLVRYPEAALANVNQINGINYNDTAAITGVQ
jgi:hypothetical protein